MEEQPPTQSFEREVSEISQAIEARRDALERESGIVEEKEVAREVIGEKLREGRPPANTGASPPSASSTATPTDQRDSYLDTLDDESSRQVSVLVERMREKGIAKATAEARENDPYILDAFHDVLVDKLYDELKERGDV